MQLVTIFSDIGQLKKKKLELLHFLPAADLFVARTHGISTFLGAARRAAASLFINRTFRCEKICHQGPSSRNTLLHLGAAQYGLGSSVIGHAKVKLQV